MTTLTSTVFILAALHSGGPLLMVFATVVTLAAWRVWL